MWYTAAAALAGWLLGAGGHGAARAGTGRSGLADTDVHTSTVQTEAGHGPADTLGRSRSGGHGALWWQATEDEEDTALIRPPAWSSVGRCGEAR